MLDRFVRTVALAAIAVGLGTPASGGDASEPTEVRPGQLVTVPLSGSRVLTDGCLARRSASAVVVRPSSAAVAISGLPDPWAVARGNALATFRVSRRAVVGSYIVVWWTAAPNPCFRLTGSTTLAVVDGQAQPRCLSVPFRSACPSTKSKPSRAATPTAVSQGPARR